LFAAGTISAYSAAAAFAQTTDNDMPLYWHHGWGMMGGNGYMGGFGMIFGSLVLILLLVLIIAGVAFVLRHSGFAGMTGGAANGQSNADRAMSILKERFARGEIDAKEFDERRRLLES
jgi:putative membrane protein